MNNTTLPTIMIDWHHKGDFGYHDVALTATIDTWLKGMPVGTEFTAQETVDLIQAAISWSTAVRRNPDEYDRDISNEGGGGSVIEIVKGVIEHYAYNDYWRNSQRDDFYVKRLTTFSETEYEYDRDIRYIRI